jgi:hypothetical protein
MKRMIGDGGNQFNPLHPLTALGESIMLTRRKFLKIFSLAGLAVTILPSFLVNRSFSSSGDDPGTHLPVRNWLYGSARRGCSSPDLAGEYHGRLENGLKDFAYYRLPSGMHIDFV